MAEPQPASRLGVLPTEAERIEGLRRRGFKIVFKKRYSHPPIRTIIRTSDDPEEIARLIEALEQSGEVSRSTIVKCRKAAQYRLSELNSPQG